MCVRHFATVYPNLFTEPIEFSCPIDNRSMEKRLEMLIFFFSISNLFSVGLYNLWLSHAHAHIPLSLEEKGLVPLDAIEHFFDVLLCWHAVLIDS